MLRLLCCIFCILLTGCGVLNKIGISNPFSPSPVDVNDIYYGGFPDISIPNDMDIDKQSTLISVGPDGEKIGLLVFSGRIDRESLCIGMIHNMLRQGWLLRGVVDGKRTVQLYKKKKRYAMLYIHGSSFSSTVEAWVIAQVDDGVYQPDFSQKGCKIKEKESSYLTPNLDEGMSEESSMDVTGLEN